MIILLLVTVLVGAFFYLQRQKKEVVAVAPLPKPAPVVDIKNEDKMVNKYLQQAAQNVERQRVLSERSLIEARKRLEDLERRKRNEEQQAAQNIPLEQQIWKEPVGESAAEILDAEISQAQARGFSSEQEKQEYARQFIENARRGGYHIELSEDLEVIQAVPIRKPSQEKAVEAQPEE